MKRVFIDSVADSQVISMNAAVTLGVFDGMHQGHLSVLNLTCKTGTRLNIDKIVVTFANHPEKLLNCHSPEMILTLEHRLRLIERCGVDLTVIIPFNEEIRIMPAIIFLNSFLIEKLNCQAIILGRDTAFGRNREGDFNFLSLHKDKFGFEVQRTPEVKVREKIISSTRIRQAIRNGELSWVEEMLGRELSFMGKVIAGDGRGRKIGFPTANLDCSNAILPPAGVYSVKVLHNKVTRRGVMNIGVRPTFYHGASKMVTTVEVHLPNFTGDLYEKNLEVFIARKIRDEKRFNSVAELIEAINQDIASM